MISPAADVIRLPTRPPIRTPPQWCRIIVQMFTELIRPIYLSAWRRRTLRAEELMKAIGGCDSRDALEALIGRPRYSLDGAGFRWSPVNAESIVPDFVEVYQRQGCGIDIWFREEKVIWWSAFPVVTWWDAVAGMEITINSSRVHCE